VGLQEYSAQADHTHTLQSNSPSSHRRSRVVQFINSKLHVPVRCQETDEEAKAKLCVHCGSEHCCLNIRLSVYTDSSKSPERHQTRLYIIQKLGLPSVINQIKRKADDLLKVQQEWASNVGEGFLDINMGAHNRLHLRLTLQDVCDVIARTVSLSGW